ncbi:acetolactate synthase, small subunit [Geoalkalibacter ferrihydriticus]|uniref:Acetolactate synthase small subunit n=2 Tax=Geoalkalibacter ferrihydriticus TaxID=392333 RepID=A0A0C2DT21_9BACT|nr:acetolactate synthase small subunit [Geoalkalibacter ferrihydriticus]KIH76599.1 acetolactate synthase [Geoalkalibacter ferrihydriticus DSM 17813]SDM03060.1 acetolactate synthase, small subunit [Geoalkalibacter ferrihydriticus]
MKHTISVLVENEFGVLARVAGLFSGRGFNIESLSVATTLDPSISRMTIVTSGDDQILEQITKQLNKLIDTIKVIDFTGGDFVEREMALVKVCAEEGTRAEVLRVVDIFRAKVVDVTAKSYTVEVTGAPGKINAIIELLRPLGIKEIVRSGPVVIGRGPKGWKNV